MFLITVGIICLISAFTLAAKVQSFPYRLNYEQRKTIHRMNGFFVASVCLTPLGGIALIRSRDNRRIRKLGWTCIVSVPALVFFGIPNQVHSITSTKNVCINNLRQIDGAKEQWALEKSIEGKPSVSMADIAPFLKSPNPKCPEGGVYILGKIDELPKCSIAGHSL